MLHISVMAAGRACLSDDDVVAFLGGHLEPDAIASAESHLDGCSTCRRLVAANAPRFDTTATLLQVGDSTAPRVLTPSSPIDGQYRIERVLGHGGMGVVYLARDLRLDRDVALKVGTTVSRLALGRVEREAVALAKLQHQNVVVVHQVGELGGRLYIAMEYVAGGNAREWLASRPRTWREIVALYAAAGDGLAAAHAAGLVHRDFKPDNVLVGDDDRPRVADFGLVRAGGATTDEDRPDSIPPSIVSPALDPMTMTGAVLGTPAYMAPEQIDGESVDARADQFAFCVALWEALAGARPYKGRTPDELAKAIDAGPPSAPGRARAPRHVIAALRRGLAPRREHRFPSMVPLLAALRRDPAVRRRRAAIGGAIVVAAAAAASGALVLTRGSAGDPPCADGAARIASVWSDARAAKLAAGFASAGASASWPAIHDAFDQYARAWAVAHDEACRATRVIGSQTEAILDQRNLCLERARAGLDAIAAPMESGTRGVIASAPRAIGLLPDLGACADVAKLSEWLKLPTDPAMRAQIEQVADYLTRLQTSFGTHSTKSPRQTGAVAVALARSTSWPPLVSEAMVLRANLLADAGDEAASAAAYREAAAAALTAGDDDDAARAFSAYAEDVVDSDSDEAMRWIALARGELERLGSPPTLAVNVINAEAQVLQRRGDLTRMLADQREVLRMTLATWHTSKDHEVIARGNLALALVWNGQGDEANREMDAAVALAEQYVGKDHPLVGTTLDQAAVVATMTGNAPKGIARARRALAILEAWYGPDDPVVLEALLPLGESLSFMPEGRTEARAVLTRGLAIMQRVGSPPADLARTEGNIATLDAQDGHPADAIEHSAHALAILEKAWGKDSPELNASLLTLGIASRDLGKLDDSIGYLARNVTILEHASGVELGAVLNAHIELSYTLVAQGKAAEALATLAPVSDAIATHAATRPEVLAEGHLALAGARWANGEHDRGRAEATAARDGFAALGAEFTEQRDAAAAWLAAHR
jgi:tetratricopeptide (TPR) repeat protein